MGATQNFTLRPVHAHINLLGWTTMALAGLTYSVFPRAGESRLARAHFWLVNLAQPAMLVALSMLLFGRTGVEPVLALSEIVATTGIAVFAANLFLNLKQ
jgi:cbb3-type cytochrome oxidase subunit 1